MRVLPGENRRFELGDFLIQFVEHGCYFVLGRVNTIQGIRNECEMDEEGEDDIQLVET